MKKYGKKIIAAVSLAAFAAFAAEIPVDRAEAASRADIAKIVAPVTGKFKYWEKNSAAKKEIIAFVKDVTDEGSRNFIPVEERIAVFDFDGTIVSETGPYRADWMMVLNRVLRDKNYAPDDELVRAAAAVNEDIRNRRVTHVTEDMFYDLFPKVMAGMSVDEYKYYVTAYVNTVGLEKFTNLKVGESFYLPMAELVSYLVAHDFKVYVVTGTEREFVRVMLEDIIPVPPERVIGSDHAYRAKNQGNVEGSRFFFTEGDEIIRSAEKLDVNQASNKVFKIKREIGRKPVLAFGNDADDFGMLQYAVTDNKNKSAAFLLINDDKKREFGNDRIAAKMKKAADEYGWSIISMADDFADIYGARVRTVTKHAGE